ncbi:hypothetical protein [Kocuria tytonicola]|uniref:hypothetical protein n=1 Tax=Kocuria tytonicola TaxID=2055946 RepID=UPI00140299A5|nr:hypothetical protein [Kocuria tytonicola]
MNDPQNGETLWDGRLSTQYGQVYLVWRPDPSPPMNPEEVFAQQVNGDVRPWRPPWPLW